MIVVASSVYTRIEEVSRHLGHSRTSTTLDVYTHQFKKASQHTANAMKKALDDAKKIKGSTLQKNHECTSKCTSFGKTQ